jgi:hypothetical protein
LASFSADAAPLLPELAPRPRLEESFTIHLGSQLKQTHNVRIVAMDMMDLCALDHLKLVIFTTSFVIIISLFTSPLLGHRPSLWIAHKGNIMVVLILYHILFSF